MAGNLTFNRMNVMKTPKDLVDHNSYYQQQQQQYQQPISMINYPQQANAQDIAMVNQNDFGLEGYFLLKNSNEKTKTVCWVRLSEDQIIYWSDSEKRAEDLERLKISPLGKIELRDVVYIGILNCSNSCH